MRQDSDDVIGSGFKNCFFYKLRERALVIQEDLIFLCQKVVVTELPCFQLFYFFLISDFCFESGKLFFLCASPTCSSDFINNSVHFFEHLLHT